MDQIKVELQEFMGTDRSIADAAWTSSLTLNGKGKRSDEDVSKVVRYLIKHRHSTPIESVVMRFWIKMPIQTDRQHMTHRIGTHNGMSGRYRTMPTEYYEVPDDIIGIIEKMPDRQREVNTGLILKGQYDLFEEYYHTCELANNLYQAAMILAKEAKSTNVITNDEYKRFREFYRGILPQNNLTERVTIFNLRSFANYMKLRNSPHAQPEIRQVAKLMLEEVKKNNVAPEAISILESVNWEI